MCFYGFWLCSSFFFHTRIRNNNIFVAYTHMFFFHFVVVGIGFHSRNLCLQSFSPLPPSDSHTSNTLNNQNFVCCLVVLVCLFLLKNIHKQYTLYVHIFTRKPKKSKTCACEPCLQAGFVSHTFQNHSFLVSLCKITLCFSIIIVVVNSLCFLFVVCLGFQKAPGSALCVPR